MAYLERSGRVQLTVAPYLRQNDVRRAATIVLAAPVTPELAHNAGLVDFVRGGGGLVCLGESTDDWGSDSELRDVFGLEQGRRSPTTELIVRVPANSDHPFTRRLDALPAHDHYAGLDSDAAFALTDSFVARTTDETPLLLASWHSQRLPVAWLRAVGAGQVFYTSLGTQSASWANPTFQQLVYRAIVYSCGMREAEAVRVAMLGYGAIGFEHGSAAQAVPGLEFVAVCDRSEARLDAARQAFGDLHLYTDAADVAADPNIDLVIISTPPNTHALLAHMMVEAGKHVVVEKPFCLNTAEADTLIAAAQRAERVLSVYQCRRWDADFVAIRAAIARGLIGDVFHLETFIGGFTHPCDAWHSDEATSGGLFYDWGSHYLDWILEVMPDRVTEVSGFAHKRVWHDVTNADQARIMVRFEGGQEAEFTHSDIAAAYKPKWYILGTRGAIVANWREETVKTRRWSGDLIEAALAPSEALPRVTAHIRHETAGIDVQTLALGHVPPFPFHRNLANHILLGEPLAVTPQQARRNIAVMEAATTSMYRGGGFVAVRDANGAALAQSMIEV